MTIEIKDGTMISCMWFVEGKDQDWMATVFKPKGENWKAEYRFRYYEDSKTHGSDDRKSVYTIETKSDDHATERKLCEAMNMIANMTLKHFDTPDGKVHKLVIKSDRAEQVMKAMAREDWCHAREDTVANDVRDHFRMR
jgi:hypothetical protein